MHEDYLDIYSLKYEMQENNQKPLIEINGKVKMECVKMNKKS